MWLSSSLLVSARIIGGPLLVQCKKHDFCPKLSKLFCSSALLPSVSKKPEIPSQASFPSELTDVL